MEIRGTKTRPHGLKIVPAMITFFGVESNGCRPTQRFRTAVLKKRMSPAVTSLNALLRLTNLRDVLKNIKHAVGNAF